MGVAAERADDGTVHINASALSTPEAPYELVKTMIKLSSGSFGHETAPRLGDALAIIIVFVAGDLEG